MAFAGMKSEDWDANSKEYAMMPVTGPIAVPCKRLLASLDAAAPLSSATSILDVGCGPGTAVSLLFSEYGSQIPSSAQIIATDYSAGMVDCVRERQKETAGKEADIGGCWGRLETRVCDAQDLRGFKDGEVSHITGSLVYFMLPEPRKGLEEALRVLKAGGALSLSSWRKVEWMELLGMAVKRTRPDAPTGFDIEKMGAWTSAEGVKGELEACGFRDVTTEYVEVQMPMEDPAKFANGFIRGNNPGIKMMVGGFSNEELDRVCTEWIKLVHEQGNNVKGIAVVATGKK